ncbi:hypothetical protein F4678DRAFT_479238 [Xylaria arbuscula]|nr:hypothetical protein F4678DRAFT_479238 [Xylaria arbuscula]
MSSRLNDYGPNVTRTHDSGEYSINQDLLPTGTVRSTGQRFRTLSSQFNPSEDPNSLERQRLHTFMGQGRPPHSRFTKYSTGYLDVPDFRTPPATRSVVIHSCGRHRHEEHHVQKSGARTPLFLQPSCRKSFSMGHLCNKFGLTEVYSSSGQHESGTSREMNLGPNHSPSSTITYDAQSFANPLFPNRKLPTLPLFSRNLHDTSGREKWGSARDMFMQYDISQPSGWFSDLEDLSLSGDGNASPRRYCRHCHICSTATWAPTHCSTCGHRLCERCACEISSGTPQAHVDLPHHHSHVIAKDESPYESASRSNLESTQRFHQQLGMTGSASNNEHGDHVDEQSNRRSNYRSDSSWRSRKDEHEETRLHKNPQLVMRDNLHTSEEQHKHMQDRSKQFPEKNPFIFRDRKSQEQEVAKATSLHDANRVECDDPMCRATHSGHHPFRHSVSCPKHQSKQKSPILDRDNASDKLLWTEAAEKPRSDPDHPSGQATVHRHHSAGFHSSQHIAEHLSSAVGHNAYDLLEGRHEKRVKPSSSKSSIKPGLYLEPLTKAKSVTEIDSFQWTPDHLPPGHPYRSGNGGQQSPGTKATAGAPDRQLLRNTHGRPAHEPTDTMLGAASVNSIRKETHNDSNAFLHDNEPQKLRLASTPSWLMNPTKEAADATAPLHHISTKNHRPHEHDHGYFSSVTADG